MAEKKRKSGGARKYDRNRSGCENYTRLHRREKNKIRKLVKYLKKWPNAEDAKKALRKLVKQFPQFERGTRHVI